MKKPEIEKRLKEIVKNKFGEDFYFRPGQYEAIVDILDTYYNGNTDTYVLEAPTGSGKSLIAMICSAFFHAMNLRGYILTSEIALQNQYVNDFSKYNLDWGSVKGSDTYSCAVNGKPFSLGECRIQKLSYEQAERLPCWDSCGYLVNRKKAITTPISLLNYSYALIQRNYVEIQQQKQGHGVPFPARDFVFCDEAHKLPDIVQNHFAPRLNQQLIDDIKTLQQFESKNGYGSEDILKPVTDLIFLIEKEDSKKMLETYLNRLYTKLLAQRKKDSKVLEVASKFTSWGEIPNDYRKVLFAIDRVKDVFCKVEDFLGIIERDTHKKLVKTVTESVNYVNDIVFNYVDEGYLTSHYFNNKFGFKVLMSATFGNPKYYMQAIGKQDARFNRMKSYFKYDKSPIYFMNNNRLNHKNIDEKLPKLVEKITQILDTHEDLPGIIHSSSYVLAKKVWNRLPEKYQDRIHLYTGTDEKMNAIDLLTKNKNKIIMGPSLLEGLDLKDDFSRLQIFLKVPYPNMVNNFVKEKITYYPDWYRWKAEIAIRQGVGRSIRNENDWAITYFLDTCLKDLLHDPLSFDKDFRDRLVYVSM